MNEPQSLPAPSLPQFQAWIRLNQPLAVTVCRAQAMAELLREQVDAYLQPIFAKYQFQYSGELAKKMKRSGPVPKPAKLFLSEDPRIPQYYEECDAEHRRQGYVDLPKDHCPALTAKSLQIQAEEALMASANQVFGLKRSPYMPDARAKYLDLLMTACLSSNSKPREIQ